MSPTDAEQWETIALFNKYQTQNLRTKYDALKASHTKLVEVLRSIGDESVYKSHYKMVEMAKQALAEAKI